MKRDIIIGVATAVSIAIIFGAWKIIEKAPAKIIIPSGAVVSFALDTCPDSWEEYELAYGRFIRGVDKSGQDRDSDGQRDVGSHQRDSMTPHSHTYRAYDHSRGPNRGGRAGNDRFSAVRTDALTKTDNTSSSGKGETRPKNVALLYCKKI